MISEDGYTCLTCGSEAPTWDEPDQYDGPEDFGDACDDWEYYHSFCGES